MQTFSCTKSSTRLLTRAGLSFLLLFSTQACPESAPARQTGPVKVARLEQKLIAYGTSELLIGENGIEYRIPKQNLRILAFAPDWKLMVYNTKTKMASVQPYEQWSRKITGKEALLVKSRQTRAAYYQGKPARLTVLSLLPSESDVSKSEFIYRDADGRAQQYNRIELLEPLATNIKLKPQQAEFIRWKLGVPQAGGLVVQQQNFYPSGKRDQMLETISISQTTVSPDAWRYPSDFTRGSMATVKEEKKKYMQAAEMFGTLILDKKEDK